MRKINLENFRRNVYNLTLLDYVHFVDIVRLNKKTLRESKGFIKWPKGTIVYHKDWHFLRRVDEDIEEGPNGVKFFVSRECFGSVATDEKAPIVQYEPVTFKSISLVLTETE